MRIGHRLGRVPRRWPFPRGRVKWGALRRGLFRLVRPKWVRRTLVGAAVAICLVVVAALGLWWRLSVGPIEFNIATPWVKSAVEQNFGKDYRVEVGGAQIERDDRGRPSLRLLDVAVFDREGAQVAAAPKAEISLSGRSLLTGQIRAAHIALVGAELSISISTEGQVTVSTGASSKPLARATLPGAEATTPAGAPATRPTNLTDFAAALAWIDHIGKTGLEGYDLRQIGLKDGHLIVDDRRTGKRWAFSQIDMGVARPSSGGVIFRLESHASERAWQFSAAIRPLGDDIRAVGIEARDIPVQDLLLAMRVNGIETRVPLSASIRAELSAGGVLRAARGQLIAGAGSIRGADQPGAEIKLESADIRAVWDARQQSLALPFRIRTAGLQLTMLARFEADANNPGQWRLAVTRADPVVDPIIMSLDGTGQETSFAFNRVAIGGRFDPAQQRVVIDQGDIGRTDTRPAFNVGVAVTGTFNYSDADPQLNFGVAGTRMPLSIFKGLWPAAVAPPVRDWVDRHVSEGIVERVLIAANIPLSAILDKGTPIPGKAMSIEVETSATAMRPVAILPEVRDADLSVRVTGRSAQVSLGRGTLEVGDGRRLNIAGGQFTVPDTSRKSAPARAVFRVDGAMPAAAALLAREGLRAAADLALDPATTRGTMSAQVTLDLTLAQRPQDVTWRYLLSADLNNFTAERFLMGHKIESTNLKVTADSDGYAIRGNVKIGDIAAGLEFKRSRTKPTGELRLAATLDEAARQRVGMNFGAALSGSIAVKLAGDVKADADDFRLDVEADLTGAAVDNLVPGWVKLAGRPARASFVLSGDGKASRMEDLTVTSGGVQVKGAIDLDAKGEFVAANFPVFALSEGDKATLKVDRAGSKTYRVALRGEVYDGRDAIKFLLGNSRETNARQTNDIDLDIRIGTVAGFTGETVRGLELRMNRRGGQIRSLALRAKIGRDTPLIGDLRLRSRDGRQVVYLETDDAGALFRFVDAYPRMFGGRMWTALDPPGNDGAPQTGLLSIRDFAIRGEPGLDRVVSGLPEGARGTVAFSELQTEFTRQGGRMTIRDGVVRGPTVGATIDGTVDFSANAMRLRGTFVPLYAINNVFGQIPIVGMILGGGSKEGLLGINYEASGPPNAPRITVNPISAVAPGLLRKLLPAPSPFDPNFVQPRQ